MQLHKLICPPPTPALSKNMKLYHATTQKKAKKYKETGCILKPVRGFTTLMGAMAWALKVNRTVIYEIESEIAYKLPDHHNKYGEAWWFDEDIKNAKCIFSAIGDA